MNPMGAGAPRILSESLLTSQEVADLFRVAPVTVNRWADQGRLPSLHNPGGRRLYRETDVQSLIRQEKS